MEKLGSEVLANFRRGDPLALRDIIERYQERLYRIGWRMFGQASDAADFAQDAFIRIYEKRQYYDPNRPFEPWLIRVAVNVGRERLRRRREIPFEVIPETPIAPLAEVNLLRQEQQAAVREALQQISPDHRECLALRFESDLSLQEIALALKLSLGTVKSRLSRGLKAFAKVYSQPGGESHGLQTMRSEARR
jgi:RNA polymerase sigma-70 factor, ECF subfamily